ncbi:DUF4345 domain-containing protein [Rhizobium lentis]|uniref:AGROH133_08824 family phage infection protein n=1 Tax=Rhizobium lentis TaxID=1138194 RepID=UPI001C8295FA|nr:DUF4345 family protein [Rhizobium lentis]MBX4958837.1 DUF4345 domain-containing protein [Rhizobium lentis]MBX4977017.1 DUF4345 domain-containing protein [Rhizobium lentis]MBX4988843.1 DUF4345 domain-containing protein [Rhizobium lentis]MBX5001319.1 DUF4345 domain-containing protein [Rhizobium lentis]MBX5007292.1 DUF4345 domain-containing protein [Rhizobium lentis]
MEFYFPTEFGEQLAFCSAAFTALAGFLMMFAPGHALRLLGLQAREGRPEGYGEARSMGGFYLGFGASAIMLAQNWIYMALGASFVMAAFARVISILSDKGSNIVNYLLLVVHIALAALPLLYVFGFFQT